MRKFKNRGFTLIELIMVIVIIGILAAVAIPMYVGLQTKARKAAEEGVVGGIRGGISVYHASLLVGGATVDTWPAVLDEASGTCGVNNPFFSYVLSPALTDSNWSKAGTVYTGPASGTYEYNSTDGTFD